MRKDLGTDLGLADCGKEPIQFPGSIQPFGALLVVDNSRRVLQVSENLAAYLGESEESLLGRDFTAFFTPAIQERLQREVRGDEPLSRPLKVEVEKTQKKFDLTMHRAPQGKESRWVVELEPTYESETSLARIYPRIQETLQSIESATSVESLADATAQRVRELTGYDRVLIYEFDADWNGSVIAESRASAIEPFLGLRFPASDIPPQARALYEKNWLRIIPDIHYSAAALRPLTDASVDLSFANLRSVSPVHLKYLKNMGVGASMSISILREGKLWGLIACHHKEARPLAYEIRQGLEFIGKFFSLRLAAKVNLTDHDRRRTLKGWITEWEGTFQRGETFIDRIYRLQPPVRNLAEGANGVASIYRGKIQSEGEVPSELVLGKLFAWLKKNQGTTPLFCTDHFTEFGLSGILSISVPEPDPSYVVWVKPEVVQTVRWGGNPQKTESPLNPRHSFAVWKETVRGRSTPWKSEELEAAELFRRALIEADLAAQVEAVIRSNEDLDEFASFVAHDLKEPLRGIATFSSFLQMDAGTKLDAQAHEYLGEIQTLAVRAKQFVSDLYEFSKIGKQEFAFTEVDLDGVLSQVLTHLRNFFKGNPAHIAVEGKLGSAICDHVRIGEVFSNLITNGVKYNDSPEKRIVIGREDATFYVRDNGMGIPESQQAQVFRIFERLHPNGLQDGSGVGLAIVKKIIQRHGGKLWMKSAPGEGSTFFFTLESK